MIETSSEIIQQFAVYLFVGFGMFYISARIIFGLFTIKYKHQLEKIAFEILKYVLIVSLLSQSLWFICFYYFVDDPEGVEFMDDLLFGQHWIGFWILFFYKYIASILILIWKKIKWLNVLLSIVLMFNFERYVIVATTLLIPITDLDDSKDFEVIRT